MLISERFTILVEVRTALRTLMRQP